MRCIPRHTICIKQKRIGDPDRVTAKRSQKQFRIIETVEIIDRIPGSEANPLDLLQIDEINSLILRCCPAKLETFPDIPQAFLDLPLKQRRL